MQADYFNLYDNVEVTLPENIRSVAMKRYYEAAYNAEQAWRASEKMADDLIEAGDYVTLHNMKDCAVALDALTQSAWNDKEALYGECECSPYHTCSYCVAYARVRAWEREQ